MATKKTLDKRTVSVNNYIALMVAVSLLAILVTGFVVNILGREFIMNTKVIIGKQQAVSDLEKKKENADSLMTSYENLGERRDLVEHAMPNSADFPQIVTIINNAAQTSGVRVSAISPNAASLSGSSVVETPASSSGEAAAYKFGMDVEGSYARVRDFIKNLELSARPIKIDAISIRGDGDSLRVSMTGTTYYQSEATLEDKLEPVK